MYDGRTCKTSNEMVHWVIDDAQFDEESQWLPWPINENDCMDDGDAKREFVWQG